MSSSFAIAPTQPKATQALLRERLSQLEAALLEARGRVMLSFDRELASLRGWMDSLEHFDPTVGLQSVPETVSAPSSASLELLMAEPPKLAASNILPFTTSAFFGDPDPLVEEPPLDPALASATLDELNAALTAAFQHMAQNSVPPEPLSA
jgi:hypothetical protein